MPLFLYIATLIAAGLIKSSFATVLSQMYVLPVFDFSLKFETVVKFSFKPQILRELCF